MSETPAPAEQPQAILPDMERTRHVEQLRREVNRLKFDTSSQEIPERNFDPSTGEDLRSDELKRLQSIRDSMAGVAERDMGAALGVREDAKFSKYTGAPIPEKQLDERGIPSVDSLQARVGTFRGDVQTLVERAKASGVAVPRFDSRTGEAIPQDSLRALQEVNRRQVPQDEMTQLHEELDMGLKALAEMKRIRREDEAARKQSGLPVRK